MRGGVKEGALPDGNIWIVQMHVTGVPRTFTMSRSRARHWARRKLTEIERRDWGPQWRIDRVSDDLLHVYAVRENAIIQTYTVTTEEKKA